MAFAAFAEAGREGRATGAFVARRLQSQLEAQLTYEVLPKSTFQAKKALLESKLLRDRFGI
jgi:hypothetical protein